MDPNREYVLFASTGVGLGYLLTALLNSAYYAWRTGSAFAIDMREFHYVSARKNAGFFEHFALEYPADLEVITGLDTTDRLRQDPDLHFLRLETERLDVDHPFPERIHLIPCQVPGEPYPINSKRKAMPFRVNLRGKLLEAWQETVRRKEWSGPVIGLHDRSTVGEVAERMTMAITLDYEERYRGVKYNCVAAAIAVVAERGFADPNFLETSDDKGFVSYVRESLPNSFSLVTRPPDQGWAAWVCAHGHDFGVLSEAVNDLWCLSACNHLVHSRGGFNYFAILNSPKLDEGTARFVHVPVLNEILDSLGPEEAVAWARGAVRKSNIHRHRQQYRFNWLADALDRGGRTDEAALARRRGPRHWEVTFRPVMDNPDKLAIKGRARRRDSTWTLERAQRAVRELPGNPLRYSGDGGSLSYILAQIGRFEEAITPARKAVEFEPGNPFLQEQLGFMLTNAGKLDKGEQAICQAIVIDPEIARFNGALGDNLMRQRRVLDTISAFRDAARFEPDDPRVIRRLACATVGAERVADAEPLLPSATEALPDMVDVHDLLSAVPEIQGRRAEAAAAARRAAELQLDDLGRRHRIARVLMEARDLEERALRAADPLAVKMGTFHHHHLLGVVLEWQGWLDHAIIEGRKASDAEPQNPDLCERVAMMLLMAKQSDEAEVVAHRVLSLRLESEQLQRLLGSIQQQRPRSTQPPPAEPEVAAPPPAASDVMVAPPPAQGLDIVRPAENPSRASQHPQVRRWREGITASLLQLLTGIPR